MNNRYKRILINAIKSRLTDGETLEDIILSYPKLTEEDVIEISAELGV